MCTQYTVRVYTNIFKNAFERETPCGAFNRRFFGYDLDGRNKRSVCDPR